MAGVLVILAIPVTLFCLQRMLSTAPALVPVTSDPPLGQSVWWACWLLAAGLILAVPSIRDTLSLGGMLDVNGPWALTTWAFLADRLDPRLFGAALTDGRHAMPAVAQVPLLAGTALVGALSVLVLIRSGPRVGGAALLLAMPLLGLRIGLLITAIMIGVLAVHSLNFWLLAIAIVVVQTWRSSGHVLGRPWRPRPNPSASAGRSAASLPRDLVSGGS